MSLSRNGVGTAVVAAALVAALVAAVVGGQVIDQGVNSRAAGDRLAQTFGDGRIDLASFLQCRDFGVNLREVRIQLADKAEDFRVSGHDAPSEAKQMGNRRDEIGRQADGDVDSKAHGLGGSCHGAADPMAAIVHIVGHGRLAPRWNEVIADLILAGFTIRTIARRVRSSRSSIHRLLRDPRAGPQFETGARIILFHARVRHGIERAPTR